MRMIKLTYFLLVAASMAAPTVTLDARSAPIADADIQILQQDLALVGAGQDDDISLHLLKTSSSAKLSCHLQTKTHISKSRVQFGFKPNELIYAMHACADHVAKHWTGQSAGLNGRVALLTRDGEQYKVMQTDASLHAPQLLFSSSVPIDAMAWKPDAKKLAYIIHQDNTWKVKVYDRLSQTHQQIFSSHDAINDVVWDGGAAQWMITMAHHDQFKLYGLRQQKALQVTFGEHMDIAPVITPKYTLFVSNAQGGVPMLHQLDAAGAIKPLAQSTQWASMPAWYQQSLYWVSAQAGEDAKLMHLDERSDQLALLAARPSIEAMAPTPYGPMIATQNHVEALDMQGQVTASLQLPVLAIASSWVYQL